MQKIVRIENTIPFKAVDTEFFSYFMKPEFKRPSLAGMLRIVPFIYGRAFFRRNGRGIVIAVVRNDKNVQFILRIILRFYAVDQIADDLFLVVEGIDGDGHVRELCKAKALVAVPAEMVQVNLAGIDGSGLSAVRVSAAGGPLEPEEAGGAGARRREMGGGAD